MQREAVITADDSGSRGAGPAVGSKVCLAATQDFTNGDPGLLLAVTQAPASPPCIAAHNLILILGGMEESVKLLALVLVDDPLPHHVVALLSLGFGPLKVVILLQELYLSGLALPRGLQCQQGIHQHSDWGECPAWIPHCLSVNMSATAKRLVEGEKQGLMCGRERGSTYFPLCQYWPQCPRRHRAYPFSP